MAQPEIPGNGIGIPGMPYGFDGSDWIALLVSALGLLQVDVVTIPYPGLGDLDRKNVSGAITSGAGYTQVVSVSGSGVLEAIGFSSNYSASEMYAALDSEHLGIYKRTGTIGNILTSAFLNQVGGECHWWKETLFDGTNNYFAFYLKRPVHYKNSLLVEVRQQSGVDKNIGCDVVYRPLA